MQVENKKKLQHEPSGMYWCECRMLILFMKCNPKHKILLGTLLFFIFGDKKGQQTLSSKCLREKFVFFSLFIIELGCMKWVKKFKHSREIWVKFGNWKKYYFVFSAFS